MKIYLGGKISKNDWRSKLLNHKARDSEGRIDRSTPTTRWRVLEKCIFGEHDCTGPFFISCDHGCTHGANTHGVAASYEEPAGYATDRFTHGESYRDYVCTGERTPSRFEVVQLCRDAIRNSDLVFVWLDDATAYGTLVEIGIAVTEKVPVRIAHPPKFKLDEMWFAAAVAFSGHGQDPVEADSPEKALQSILLSESKAEWFVRTLVRKSQKLALDLIYYCWGNDLHIVVRNGVCRIVHREHGTPYAEALAVELAEVGELVVACSAEIIQIIGAVDFSELISVSGSGWDKRLTQKDIRRSIDVGPMMGQVSTARYWYDAGHFATADEANGAFKLANQQGLDGLGKSIPEWMGLNESEFNDWYRSDQLPKQRCEHGEVTLPTRAVQVIISRELGWSVELPDSDDVSRPEWKGAAKFILDNTIAEANHRELSDRVVSSTGGPLALIDVPERRRAWALGTLIDGLADEGHIVIVRDGRPIEKHYSISMQLASKGAKSIGSSRDKQLFVKIDHSHIFLEPSADSQFAPILQRLVDALELYRDHAAPSLDAYGAGYQFSRLSPEYFTIFLEKVVTNSVEHGFDVTLQTLKPDDPYLKYFQDEASEDLNPTQRGQLNEHNA